MSFDNVNVNVSGGQSIINALQNYTTIILKPNIIYNRNVLTQEMISEKHTKYIIKWNYSLEDVTINVPKDCIIEFAGGTIDNGTIVGDNTILIYSKSIDEVCTAERQGTFIYNTTVADEEDITSENGYLKFKDRFATNGMGRKILRKNIINGVNTLTQDMVPDANTIYIIQYNFDLGGKTVTIPKDCVLEFDGGSLSNGTLLSKNSTIIAPNRRIFNDIDIPADNFYVKEALVDWFYSNDLGNAFTKAMNLLPNVTGTIKCSSRIYNLTTPCLVKSRLFVDFNSCTINVNSSIPVIVDLNYGSNTPYSVSYTKIHNVNIFIKVKPNSNYYTIDVANSANCEYKNIIINTAYENIESNDKIGIAIGRIANGYNGTRSCNTIDNCFCRTIFIHSNCNEGTITNCKLWASEFIASIYFHTNSNWIVDNNQFVGGSKGAIYIPNNNTLYNVRITNNYFDGSHYNIDTHNGIYTEIETSSGTTAASITRCIIANNLFWHQKERGIYIKARDCIISNNVFDDCDNWNYGIEDINIDCLFCSNIISGNIFSRLKYNIREHPAEKDRITTDSESFTRPACIVISNGYEGTVAIVTNNFVRNKDAYNNVQFGSNKGAYISYNNSVIIPNCGYSRSTSQLPLKPTQGDTFFNSSLHRTVIWDGRWADGRGYPVTSLSGTTNQRPTSGTDGILQTYDIGYMYFDKTLNKPIWWNGTAWVDATGTTV